MFVCYLFSFHLTPIKIKNIALFKLIENTRKTNKFKKGTINI